ncbi:MAG: hypothetical protein R6V05_13550 [Candidatus Brocadiia bacterium]
MLSYARIFVWGLLFLVAGCAWQAELPAVPASHPANPEAEAAPVVRPSDVLSVRQPAPTPHPMEMMHHEGHGKEVAP